MKLLYQLCLLLLAALCFSVSANPFKLISVGAAKRAIKESLCHYARLPKMNKPQSCEGLSVMLENGKRKKWVKCNFKGGSFNYRLPDGYRLRENEANQVGAWFMGLGYKNSKYWEPNDKKYGGRMLNCIMRDTEGKKAFNYHLETDPEIIDAPEITDAPQIDRNSIKSRIVKILLSGLLLQ